MNFGTGLKRETESTDMESLSAGAVMTAAFVAEAPEMPGCIAYGDTQETGLQQVNEVLACWPGTIRGFGDSIPDSKGVRLMLG
jgi:predicted RNase H-like HicB family nuclease